MLKISAFSNYGKSSTFLNKHNKSFFFSTLGRTYRGAGFIQIKNSESTTIQISLNICSCAVSVIPSHLQKLTLEGISKYVLVELFHISLETNTVGQADNSLKPSEPEV